MSPSLAATAPSGAGPATPPTNPPPQGSGLPAPGAPPAANPGQADPGQASPRPHAGQDGAALPGIEVTGLAKSFTLHTQGGTVIPVMQGAELTVMPGECVGLTGRSGAGKSTLMRMIYGNYLTGEGSIRILGAEISGAAPRQLLAIRRSTLGHVSQFLRVVPRVPALDVVAEPLLQNGAPRAAARAAAAALLTRLNIPERLWGLSPTTFSGGEQQRVNIARGFIHPWPVLLLDEPTASLDAGNREVVLELILEARARGAAILGIFHDEGARARVCNRLVDVTGFTPGLSQ